MTLKEYNTCVDLYADGLYRFVLKSIRDKETSQDIIQDTFLKLWQLIDEVEFKTAKPYLYKIAYNSMIDTIRKTKTNVDYETDETYETYETKNFNWELKDIIDIAVNNLSDIQRHMILLRDYEGYSYKEIGEITKTSEAQVKINIFRARQKLREVIGKLENVI